MAIYDENDPQCSTQEGRLCTINSRIGLKFSGMIDQYVETTNYEYLDALASDNREKNKFRKEKIKWRMQGKRLISLPTKPVNLLLF